MLVVRIQDRIFASVTLALRLIFVPMAVEIRIPAWASEFDFWGDAPHSTYDFKQTEHLLSTNKPLSVNSFQPQLPTVAAIFSTYEQNRISVLQEFENRSVNLTKIGKLWGNGELNRDSDTLFHAKHPILINHPFNLCFENSISPGYITEKILHARMAGCVALTYSHSTFRLDYNPKGIINFEDFLDVDSYFHAYSRILSDSELLLNMRSSPVFTSLPQPELLVKRVQLLLSSMLRSVQ